MEVRQRMVDHFYRIDEDLGKRCAAGVGIDKPSTSVRIKERLAVPVTGRRGVESSPALSMADERMDTIQSRRIAILAAEGSDLDTLIELKETWMEEGATVEIVSKQLGTLGKAKGQEVKADQSYLTTGSIMYDAVFVPGGRKAVEMLMQQGDALQFINESFRHCKPIGAVDEGINLLNQAHLLDIELAGPEVNGTVADKGVVTGRKGQEFSQAFSKAIAMHRHWDREDVIKQVPA
jgi:catalase